MLNDWGFEHRPDSEIPFRLTGTLPLHSGTSKTWRFKTEEGMMLFVLASTLEEIFWKLDSINNALLDEQ